MRNTDTFTIDLSDLVMAFSEALGLVGGKIVNHGKRVTYLALSIAEGFDLPGDELNDLRTAALLHDAGVSCTRMHRKLLQLDWEGAPEHCQDGAMLLSGFPPFARPAELILHHHKKWNEIRGGRLDERTALLANLIFLADRIDVLIDWNIDLILNRDRIEGLISELSGSFFNPEAVRIFKARSAVEVFWLNLYPRHLGRALAAFQPTGHIDLGLTGLEEVASIFARIVDNKSPFTVDHSYGVANLCHYFGKRMDLSPSQVQKLRIAGLVHDLGKLAIPDEILEKPAALTPEEFQIVKRHPFETHYILSGPPALSDIRDWASFHHEKADGSGYPFHLTADALGLEHVIVMLADILQALVQDRPYRPGLDRDQVLDILAHLARGQSILAPLVWSVRADYDLAVALAKNREEQTVCVNP